MFQVYNNATMQMSVIWFQTSKMARFELQLCFNSDLMKWFSILLLSVLQPYKYENEYVRLLGSDWEFFDLSWIDRVVWRDLKAKIVARMYEYILYIHAL